MFFELNLACPRHGRLSPLWVLFPNLQHISYVVLCLRGRCLVSPQRRPPPLSDQLATCSSATATRESPPPPARDPGVHRGASCFFLVPFNTKRSGSPSRFPLYQGIPEPPPASLRLILIALLNGMPRTHVFARLFSLDSLFDLHRVSACSPFRLTYTSSPECSTVS